jgi:hypothetical protein
VLQKSQAAPRSLKPGNIRIRIVGFLNQNSIFGLDLEKVFLRSGAQNRFATLSADTVAKVPKTWTVIFSAEIYTSESRY